MKRVITVRKNRAQRIGIRIILVLMIVFEGAMFVSWDPNFWLFLLLLLPLLPVIGICMYYETWHVTLGSKRITTGGIFVLSRSYSFYQMTDAYVAHSYTLHEHICLTFCDKKCIRFRMEDEHATLARRMIQSHHSIRIANW